MKNLRRLFFVGIVFSGMWISAVAEAREPGWSLRVVTFGETRRQIESTPILQRPYRPLHFYGNTVRRRHYRGTAVPLAPVVGSDQRR